MKKSKFLKKSLAMLLAVMLVVAMIPLSASAALPEDLTAITVNGVNVSLDDPTVEVKQDQIDANVVIGLNGPLTTGWYLRAVTSGSTYKEINSGTMEINQKDGYVNVSGNTGTVTLQLVNKNTEKETVEATYTLTLNYVKDYTTTDIELVSTGDVVYSADIDNEKGEVNVVLARDNNNNPANTTAPNDTQDTNAGAQITVKGLQNATVAGTDDGHGNVTVDVDAIDTFVVTAENGTTTRTWKVNVTSYLDAFRSFTLAGQTGTFADENKNNIVDTIKVTVPKNTGISVPVTYVAEGNLHCTVDIYANTTGTGTPTNQNVESGDTITIANFNADGVSENLVKVTRLNATQWYVLEVSYEKDLDTTITYARMDRTNADIDPDARTITGLLPEYVNNTDPQVQTKLESVQLTLYTTDTVSEVYAAGVKMDPITTDLTASAPSGEKMWQKTVDLSKGPISVVVYAEDETKSTTYTVSADFAPRADDATLESFYLVDKDGNSHGGVVTGKTLTIEVPYMTFDMSDWTVLFRTSSNAKLQWDQYDLVSGVHKAGNIDLGTVLNGPDDVNTIDVRAIDKNDPTIFEDYKISVKLKNNPAEGDTIQNLRFTAQLDKTFSGADRTDTQFTNAIVRDGANKNDFNTEVRTTTAGGHTVSTLAYEIPYSLTSNNTESTYINAVTEVVPVDGALVFVYNRTDGATGAPGSGQDIYSLIQELPSTNTDVDATTTILEDGDQIFVLDEEVARAAMYAQGGNYDSINIDGFKYDGKSLREYGTMYTVEITSQAAKSAATLESFKVGNTPLDVDNTATGGTISGVLPWGLTTPATGNGLQDNDPMFAEFELSDYALLTANNGKVVFFSNGDVDGDGVADDIPAWDDDLPLYDNYKGVNRQFVFERQDDEEHSVKVYFTAKGKKEPIDSVTVLAEDRLTGEKSQKTYNFDLTWEEPETEADILTFSLDGYTGTVDNSDRENRTITVNNVPYGTDLTGMIAEFTTTPNAKVYLTNAQGVLLESGVTSVNYTNPVLLYVLSEDGLNSNSYTVTINMGLTFSDINSTQWWYDDVVAAANNGYIHGRGNGVFDPTGEITRAEFATMIANAMNYEDKPESPAAFTDVNGHWAEDAINFCAENGIIDGYADCSFRPDQTITRQEVAAILARAFDLVEESNEKYTDDNLIPEWSRDYVYLAKGSELMNGDAKGTFRPTDTLIRAEAATILMNCNRAGVIN